jgi:hypothetical protein
MRSDLVVLGVAAKEEGQMVVRVTEVLKGGETPSVRLGATDVGPFDGEIIRNGDRGIFFLNEHGAKYFPFHPFCYRDMSHEDSIRLAVDLLKNPRPYLNVKEFPENADTVFVLGELFTAWDIESAELPSLGSMMKQVLLNNHHRFFEVAPWSEKGVVTIHCTADVDGSSRVRIVSAEPEGRLSEFFEYRLLAACKWPEVRKELKPTFSVTLDTRGATRVGTLNVGDAAAYVRKRLGSSNPQIVIAALLALDKMRDADSVPLVFALLDHEDPGVQVKAIQFLGWSGDRRAVPKLCNLLDAQAPDYPKGHSISDAAALALRNIGDPTSLPCLERAATHGVERAIGALAAMGRTESFEIMLDAAERDPERCSHVVVALYCLVRRSGKKVEPWMTSSTGNMSIYIARIPKWRKWWDANKTGFKVVKSLEEVIGEQW